MFLNNILLFVRNLRRQRLFSVINLLGLTVSIASTLLIYLYVRHEFSYDRFHYDVDRIYRINQTFIWGENNNSQFASTGPGVAYAVKSEIPEVELMTSIHTPGNFIISYSNRKNEVISFEEDRVLAADTNFFKMFNFPLIAGNKENAFAQANNLVMTRSTAEKYFGNEDPIGKLVRLSGLGGEDQKTYEVTAVIEDTPENSYIEFDILLSMKAYPLERFSWSWVWTQLETYIRIDPRANIPDVRKKVAALPRTHVEQTLRAAFNTTYDDYIKSGKKWELFLQPMRDIHLPAETVINRLNESGSLQIVYSFVGAAIFIVILSCVNFMNLSTAQFTRRIKEASVRKVLGLGKMDLMVSYFLEALIFCLIAAAIGVGLTQILLPAFNVITEKSLRLDLLGDLQLMLLLFGIVILMAIISSSYPALFLGGFSPAESLKGKMKVGRKGRSFRNGLVVFQFSISIILIICTAIVFQQLSFVSNKEIGFNKQNLLVLNHVEAITSGEALANAALKLPGVEDVSWCKSVPPRIWDGDSFTAEGLNGITLSLNFTGADERYLDALGIKVVRGRNFMADNPGDIQRVIVNEAAVKKMGWSVDESVLGKKLIYSADAQFEIVGIVADFNYWSLNTPIEPMAIFHVENSKVYGSKRQFLVMRISPQDLRSWETTLASLQGLWDRHASGLPFDYSFVDQAFAEAFKTQKQFGQILTVMASLALMIAGMGLLGMIVYALEQRTKEIGIRKVTGASVTNIVILVTRSYTKLILIAFLIGAPLSYWLMDAWLQDFAYRITPSFWIFMGAGAGTLIIALLITGYHSLRAAFLNPVDVLKDE